MWCLWRSWLARQIVALEAESSNLSRHPTKDRTGAFLHGLFFYNGSSPSGKARDFDSRIREFEPRRPNHSSSCMNVQGELLFCRGDHWPPADACGNGKPSGRIWNPPLQSPLGPPLRGGSARRRWGRELYGCPKYFGLWQSSLPPPLRGTAPPLAQAPPPPYRGSLSRRGRSACQKTSTFLYRECRGDHWSPASLAQQRAFRDGFLTRHTGTGEQCSPLQEFFDRLTSLAEGGFISSKVM